ncbi:hypothetical protein AHAS_Ahas18G0045500 [Arachis hypogaea]
MLYRQQCAAKQMANSTCSSSGSMDSNQKPIKEKSVKQLTFEAKEVNDNEEHDLGTSHLETKRMDARWYRSLFRKPKNGKVEVPQRVQPDIFRNETAQMPESRNPLLDEDLVRNDVGHDGEKSTHSKRNGIMLDTGSDLSTTLADDDDCNLIPSRLRDNIVGTGGSCSKRRRLDCDPVVSSNPSTTELQDGVDTDASVLQKEYPVNSPKEVTKHTCLICKSGGQLLFCGGKGCSGCYHSSCLEPPLVDASIGVWYCHFCVRKKIELGVYSVSEGVESIWDVKEVLTSNFDGSTLAQKEYLVKYKGIAHVHNRWIPENQLLREAPSLLKNFNMKNQDQRLKLEWSLPHRLLQKRAIIHSTQQDDHNINDGVQNLNCCYEWLVKWRGLGYEHATWELDNELFLRSPEGQRLIRGYEECFQREKRAASCSRVDNVPQIDQLKERPSSHLAYKCKSDSFKFIEYWVPVQISHVQLEQYCATLHSNASILRSSAKTDIDALRDIIITARKCCIHPSIVDQTLKSRLTVGLDEAEFIDVDIKASGKLQLLDSMLMELKAKSLRGLILFKSIGGSGRVSAGDFLDDLLRIRFGPNSYERVDKGLLVSKQKDAMRKFNNKDDGRFVFLLDACACRPGIRLSSLDTIIIFDSDWNPTNDIRSLQKITIDSQPQVIKIFRLYSAFTVEENALILSKQDRILDSNLLNISRTTCQMLLMWGAASLFDDLKIFHHSETSVLGQKSSSGQQHLTETVRELSSVLSQDAETRNCSVLLKVRQNGSTYQADFPLPGEMKNKILEEELPHIFWTKLFEGKQFKWKYSCSSSQRSRKRVDLFDGSGGIAKKRRKVRNNLVDQPSSKSEGSKLSTGIKTDRLGFDDVEYEETTRLRDEQRSLYLSLKPEIKKLCGVLLLPDNVRDMVDNFLEFVVNNHHVNREREPVSMLQAFQISLIWTVAPLLKHKVDHRDSLLLAKQHLDFVCRKEEVDYIYSVLRCLKGLFLHRMGNSKDTGSPKSPESSRKVYSSKEVGQEADLFKNDVFRSIREIRKKCQEQLKKLKRMQQEEKQRLETAFEDEKAEFEKKYKIESLVIRTCSPNDVMKTEKLKVLNTEFGSKIEELKCEHETRLKALEDTHMAARQNFKHREDAWAQDVEDWAKSELSNIDASKELGTAVEYTQLSDQENAHKGSESMPLVSDHLTDEKGHDNNTNEAMPNDVQDEVHSSTHNKLDGTVSSLSCENAVQIHGAYNGLDNATTETSHLPNEGIADEAMAGILNRDAPRQPTTVTATDCLENVSADSPPPSVEQVTDGVALNEILDRCATPETSHDQGRVSILGREVPVEVETHRMVNFSECPINAAAVNHFSSVDQTSDKGPINDPDNTVSSFRCCQADGPDKSSLSNPPLVQQVTDVVSLNEPDGDTHEAADCHNDTRPSTDTSSVDKSSMIPAQLEGVQQSPSLEAPPAQDTAGEVQNSSERAEIVPNLVGVVPANQSNSCILEPSENGVEHQPNRNDLPHHETEVSAVVPNQDVVQADSNLELGSHSQAVVHSVLNSGHDSLGPVGVRREASSSSLRNLSTPSEINNHPIHTATHSASRMPLPLSADPLKNELERIKKIIEQLTKNHEEMRAKLKSDFEKELEALRRKYDIKFQLVENEFQQTKNKLDSSYHTVLVNKMLADFFRSKCMYRKTSDAYGVQQDAGVAQQSIQLARQQSATFPSQVVAGSSSRGPRGPLSANLHSPSALVSSQNSLPPSNVTYKTPSPPARLPLNCNSSPSGNFPIASEMRAPAPHLQPFRPSAPMPAPNHPALLHGMPNQAAPAIAPTLSCVPAQPTPLTYQSDPQMAHQPNSSVGTGGFSTLNLRTISLHANANTQSAVCLPRVQPSMSEVVSLNPPRIGTSVSVTPNSSSQAASLEFVCLSDDE